MRRAWRLVLATATVLVTAALVTGCASGPSTTPQTGGTGATGGSTAQNTISMKDIAFNPSTLTVKAGDTVTFKNDDQMIHDVVVGTEDLGEQQPGSTKTWKASTAGTFPIKCLIHPSMTGEITVQ